jgi:hypothetical protein
MRTSLSLTWATALLFGAASAAPAQDTPRTIIERAIKAHGGEETLTKIRAERAKVKGVLYLDKKNEVPFTAETLVQLPSQMKAVLEYSPEGKKKIVMNILNGDKEYTTIDGKPEDITDAAKAEMRDAQLVDRISRLTPLLSDKAFNLAVLDEAKVNDKPALVIKASIKGRSEFRIYFDKETNLLVKTEHSFKVDKEKEVRQEEFYSNFKDLGGFKRATKMIVLRNGVKLLEQELLDVKYLDKIDEKEFEKP